MPNVAVQSAKSWHHLTKITHIHSWQDYRGKVSGDLAEIPHALARKPFWSIFKLMVMERLKLSCMHVIGVFDPQACDTGVMHVRWQYILLPLTKLDRKFSLLVNACLSHNRQIKNCF